MGSLEDFVYRCGCDVEFMGQKAAELEKIIDAEAEERSKKKADEKFNAQKEEFQLKLLKQFQEAEIKKEGMEISATSSLISEKYTIDGVELFTCDFIPDAKETNPPYEENMLIKNSYSLEYQDINNKTGKRKFVWKESPSLVLISNPTAPGKCEDILVYLQGNKKPLDFPNGDISKEAFRKQTTFARKGMNVSVELQHESFLRELCECQKKMFLTIPKHTGGIKLPTGKFTYISADSVIPGLEELFPMEVREHKMISHPLSLEDMSVNYRDSLPNCIEAKIATTVRIESILLPVFETEGLNADCAFVMAYSNDNVKNTAITLSKRKNYSSNVVQALTDRITKIRKELETANDITVLFKFSDIFEKKIVLDNAFEEIRRDITGENGVEDRTRKIPIFITDRPERIPEDYPAYYINCSDSLIVKNLPFLQRLTGMFDYSFKEYIYNNPDVARQLVRTGIKTAQNMISQYSNTATVTDTIIMTLATACILNKLDIITAEDLRSVLHWFINTATSKSTVSDTICRQFKKAVSGAILSGEIKIAKQYGPPYYSADGHTVFIAENDKSINMDEDVVKNAIIPKISTSSVAKMNKNIKEKGFLKCKHTNKRKLKVSYAAGVLEDTEIFSYSRAVLNTEAKSYIDNIINNEFWFTVEEYPEGFVPVLYNDDCSRAAGYVFKSDMDENLHEVYFGTSRSGKTFSLVNRAIEKVETEGVDAIIIFDYTGGFSPQEIDKHIGTELRIKYFSFWYIYENGLPINPLDLNGCLTNKDKKERILQIYSMLTRSLGSYQEQILKNAVNCMLKDMKNCPGMTLSDIFKYLKGDNNNENNESVMDEAHRKLLEKLKAIIDDFEDITIHKNNWGEFVKAQGKPIIIISTGTDIVDKGSETIDMMLGSLYCYKQCYPDSKYTIVADEAQDLYLHEKGAVNTLLRKGGKHGITMLLASQSFPEPTTAFGHVVGNCGRFRGYRSKGNDIACYTDRFKCEPFEANILQKGNCFDNGLFWSRYRNENVIATLKGKTVAFVPTTDMNNNSKNDSENEQP